MRVFNYPQKNKQQILALGPESNGNFSAFSHNKIYFSEDFGDLLIDANFSRFKKELTAFLQKEKIKPSVILTDLHPLYKTTALGKDLAKKHKVRNIQIQHHFAHIFSAVGEKSLQTKNYPLPTRFYGVALDGTGYGSDGKIWGGECFAISNFQFPISNKFSNSNDKISKQQIKIERIGHLENQVMIGGDLAIQEPARMLIAILDKLYPQLSLRVRLSGRSNPEINHTNPKIATVVPRRHSLAMTEKKDFIYSFVKKYYSVQEFEVLYNQLQQNFNCIETSSTGRVLDAVSILLGFCTNKRNYKHEPIDLLEKNSTEPYHDIKPKIEILDKVISNQSSVILNTTYLFEYLIKNAHKDKKRLAATAQLYIAQGLHEIILKFQISNLKSQIFLAGGVSKNKNISEYFESKKNKTGIPLEIPAVHIPRGDAGLSFGQIIYHLN